MKDWDTTFIEIAEKFAEHSTCVKRKVGAILVKDLRILSVGYNGTPKGFANCCEIFTLQNPTTKTVDLVNGFLHKNRHSMYGDYERISHHDFAERYEIHAEQNCLSFAAKNGVATNDCTLYITTAPCVHCAKIIIASGIKRVVYDEDYKNGFGITLLKEADIEVYKVVRQ